MNILTWVIVGLIAGWLGSLIMRGRGFGVGGNIVIGILGAIIGGLVFGLFGIGTDTLLGTIAMSVIGSVILLFIVGMVRRDQPTT